jgi:hypothetical protein
VLSKANHYNDNLRSEALQGLCSLLTLHPEVLAAPAGLLRILERVLPKLADHAANVRSQAHEALKLLLAQLTPAQLEPFLPLLLAHLGIAMTQLSASVRLDTLPVLDALVGACPALLREHCGRLTANALLIISSEQSTDGIATLTTTPQSRLASLQSRMAVLQRVAKLLKLLQANPTDESPPHPGPQRPFAVTRCTAEHNTPLLLGAPFLGCRPR